MKPLDDEDRWLIGQCVRWGGTVLLVLVAAWLALEVMAL